jgi:homoserine dehydrogenase
VSRRPLTVLKLGGSVLGGESDLPQAVHEVYRWSRQGPVVVVVSAFAGDTDRLLAQARRFGERADGAALAALLATGEHSASALLCLALDRAGVCATVFDAARLGLRTSGPLLDAEPVSLDAGPLRAALDAGAVVVVPGFLGRSREGCTSLLGRGGSDLTALFLAAELGAAHCRLVKDVAGLYDRDPASAGAAALHYASVHWDRALEVGGQAVQARALRFARQRGLAFEVAALHAGEATRVGGGPTRRSHGAPPASPLRVGLLGFGTVGGGVFEHLQTLPGLFGVVGIAVRDPRRHRGAAPARLLSRDADAVVDAADVLVEALPGEQPATRLVRRALACGKAVVSANKAVLASYGPQLADLAARSGGRLLASAAAGGALPVLETARAVSSGGLRRIEAVLNGTSGCVLDQLAEGATLEAAVRLAQERGFAEADPARDLDGRDLEAKLRLLARAAFGRDPEVTRSGLAELDPGAARSAARDGAPLRLLGRLERHQDGRVMGTVRPEPIPAGHPLAGLREEQNGAAFHLDGEPPVVLRGRGAGRWPTAESVLADLLDLARDRRRPDTLADEVPA